MRQRPITNHHTRRVGGGVAREAFELHCQIDQPLHLGIILVFASEIRRTVQRARQGPRVGRVVGDHLAQPVHLAVAHLQNPPAIAQHRACLELAEGDDLRDLIRAVAVLHIADHFAAPRFAEVDVEVGHGHAFGVQEPFEQQAKFERIEVGNRQRPRHQRSRTRTAPRPHRNALRLGPFDEVGHDQEVAGEAHAGDHVDLKFEAVGVNRQRLRTHLAVEFEPRGQPCPRIIGQRADFRLKIAREARQDWFALGRGEGAALRDYQRVGGRFRKIGEQFLHHPRRFDEGLRAGARAFGGVDMRGIGDAQHRVMRGVHMRFGVIGRVGGDQRQVARIGEFDQRKFGGFFHRVTAPGEFDIQPAGEQPHQPISHFCRLRIAPFRQQPRQRALARAGERDQPVRMAIQIGQRHMRFAFQRAFQMRAADEVAQVLPASFILREQRQIIDDLAILARHAQQRAGDGLHAFALARGSKRGGAVQPVAVADGDGGEAAFLGQFGDGFGINRPLQHGIAGKHAQGDKGSKSHAA